MSETPPGSNGSWTGRDPRLRWLRTIAGVVILTLIAYIVVFDTHPDGVTLGTLAGMLLVVLGFEIGVNWPKGGGRQ